MTLGWVGGPLKLFYTLTFFGFVGSSLVSWLLAQVVSIVFGAATFAQTRKKDR